ncbi:MAG TPA: hypothetical protein VNZ64_15700 [Candidatus Acidoferrum sp.]|nr:hypothetical protein [Candidatus Acidoferrum sp.]
MSSIPGSLLKSFNNRAPTAEADEAAKENEGHKAAAGLRNHGRLLLMLLLVLVLALVLVLLLGNEQIEEENENEDED